MGVANDKRCGIHQDSTIRDGTDIESVKYARGKCFGYGRPLGLIICHGAVVQVRSDHEHLGTPTLKANDPAGAQLVAIQTNIV